MSDIGEIRNCQSGKLLTPRVNNTGYQRVSLYKNDTRKEHLVHRLVAIAFHGLQDNDKVVNHIDENKLNNRSDNLEWLTHKENVHHSIQRMRRPKKHKEIFLYTLHGKLIRSFASAVEVEEYFGVSTNTVITAINHQSKFATIYYLGTSDIIPRFKQCDTLIDYLEDYRTSARLKKENLASQLGHTLSNYRIWIKNKKIPHKELKKIAQLLEMTLDEAWDLNEIQT